MTTEGAGQGTGGGGGGHSGPPGVAADALMGFLSEFRSSPATAAATAATAAAPAGAPTDAAATPAFRPLPRIDPDPAVDPLPAGDPFTASATAPAGPTWVAPSWSPPAPAPTGPPPAPVPAAPPPPAGPTGAPPGAGWGPPTADPWGRPAYAPPPDSGNTMASVALGLGVGSLLVPLLTVPGVILGVKSLRRIRRQPWIGGKSRSILAIVASLVLGPLVAIGLTLSLLNRLHHEDMHRVQNLIASAVDASVQARTGTAPDVDVQCPSSEPRRAGTMFNCVVTDRQTGFSITMQIRETDSSGDVIFTPLTSTTN